MNKERIKKLLTDVKSGIIGIDEAMRVFKSFPYQDLDFAKIDTHRTLRKGFPEVILAKGKTREQIVKIIRSLSKEDEPIMVTKADREVYEAIRERQKDAVWYKTARVVLISSKKKNRKANKVILVMSAGTADIPIAEEAVVTAEIMGNKVERLYDVGVAGVHRVLNNKDKLFGANVIIVVAGMEGALASIIGGLVDRPVIAVPTSVGYGSNFEGLSALLTMLNCCAPGVVVVNIDNGFGAGYFASIINQTNMK